MNGEWHALVYVAIGGLVGLVIGVVILTALVNWMARDVMRNRK